MVHLKIFIPVILLLFLGSCKVAEAPSEKIEIIPAAGISIIPKPAEIHWPTGSFTTPVLNSLCINPEAEEAAEWLSYLLKNANLDHKTSSGNSCGDWNLLTDPILQKELGDEGYILEINDRGVFMSAASSKGLFYAIQTLRQILPSSVEDSPLQSKRIQLPHLYIKDVPQYSWRGTMVDVARSFFGLEYLKSHVDRMALYKMNRLHLHLTDDQGWRIEIKSKPALTSIGSKGSVKNGRSGFLTQEQYLELQDYALARNIIIIPEIDMPGHIYAALVAYPELNCEEFSNIDLEQATPPELFSGTKVGWSKLCLTKPEIYDFVSTVLGEIANITHGPWIHIGGDEIKDELYETFVVKADSIVQYHGKTTIGWEEVTKAEVSSSLISQQWHGKVKSLVDVQVIESICTSFYFDHANIPGQEKTNNWCKKTGVTLEEVYNFKSTNKNVIGFEAPVWTEFVWDDNTLDNRFWPRTIAVAELAWNHDPNRDYGEFSERLRAHQDRLQRMGVNYFPAEELSWKENPNTRINSGVFKGFMPESFKITILSKKYEQSK